MSQAQTKPKSKPQTQVKTITVTKKIEDLEKELIQLKKLQRLVIIRYSVYVGRKNLMGLKMRTCKAELLKMREISAEINKLYEQATETGKLDLSRLKELRRKYKEIKEIYDKKAKPFDQRIKPLTKQLRYLDDLIMANPTVAPYIKPIEDISEVPEDVSIVKEKK